MPRRKTAGALATAPPSPAGASPRRRRNRVTSPALEFVFRLDVTVAAPLELGPTHLGRRRVIPITGGTITGPRLKGRVLPGGADWQVIRADGTAELDARYTLE